MQISLGGRVLDSDTRTQIMAILNVGTDSPVAHSVVSADAALRRAEELREAGADIIDVGAHSTRSGARPVDPAAEVALVCPVIEALRREDHLVSVDTWTGPVARAAADAGVHLLNDVSAGADADLVGVARERQLPILIMHMRGEPTRHREVDQRYEDVAEEVSGFLADRAERLRGAGVPEVWLDPGFQFGKSLADNLRLALDLPRIQGLGCPLVISASRKGFFAELLGYGELRSSDAYDKAGVLEATIAFNVIAAWLGADLVRVHDVAEVAAALRVGDALRERMRVDAPDRAPRP